MYCLLNFIRSSLERHLSCVYLLAIMIIAIMNTGHTNICLNFCFELFVVDTQKSLSLIFNRNDFQLYQLQP